MAAGRSQRPRRLHPGDPRPGRGGTCPAASRSEAAHVSLRTTLTGLALDRVLSWQQVEELLDDAEADIEQLIRDVEFDAWWNGHIVWTRQRMAAYEMWDKLLDRRRMA